MANGSTAGSGSVWAWVRKYEGFCLVFVRGVPETRLLTAVGVDPAAAEPMTSQEMHEEFDFYYPVVRVGRVGEWAFGFQDAWIDLGDTDLLCELSAGTEVVSVVHTATIDGFDYFADGVSVVGFEPLFPGSRRGSDPDRLLPLMREVGLDPDLSFEDREARGVDPLLAVLDLVSRAWGIRLDADTVDGPLLTAEIVPPDTDWLERETVV